MGQTSRIVTIIEGVEVMKVTTHDRDGDPIETNYQVRGERHESLKAARGRVRCLPMDFSVFPYDLYQH